MCDYSLLEVSYVSIATREIFSKVGRELLAAVATAHPHIISVLLERLRETLEKVGMVSDSSKTHDQRVTDKDWQLSM